MGSLSSRVYLRQYDVVCPLHSLVAHMIVDKRRSTTVEVMILQFVCLSLSDDPGGPPKAWALLGTTVKMAEAVCATYRFSLRFLLIVTRRLAYVCIVYHSIFWCTQSTIPSDRDPAPWGLDEEQVVQRRRLMVRIMALVHTTLRYFVVGVADRGILVGKTL